MTLITRPTITNDSGNGQDGTLIDETFLDDILDEIDDQCHSTTNTTIKPKAIIDEVVTARGSLGSLDARLDVLLNDDGTLKEQSDLAQLSDLKSVIGATNLAPNADLISWPDGTSAAPAGFTRSGTGAAAAQSATLLGAGEYSVQLTYGSAEAKLTATILSALTNYTALRGRKIVVGCYCKASVPNQASLVVDDGVTTTRGGSTGNATYHAGDGTIDWIYAVHDLAETATKIEFYLSVASSGSAEFGGFFAAFADYAPTQWVPENSQLAYAGPGRFRPLGGVEGFALASGVLHKAVGFSNVGAAEQIAFEYSVPASALSENGKTLRVTVIGRTGPTTTGSTFKVYIDQDRDWTSGLGLTAIADPGNIGADANFEYRVLVVRTASNVQRTHSTERVNTSHDSTISGQTLTDADAMRITVVSDPGAGAADGQSLIDLFLVELLG